MEKWVGLMSLLAVVGCSSGNGGATPDATADRVAAVDVAADRVTDLPAEFDAAPDLSLPDTDDAGDAAPCTDPFLCPDRLTPFCGSQVPLDTAEDSILSYYLTGDTFWLDLSAMGGSWQPGDLEVTAFEAEHPFILESIRVYLSQAGPAELHLWADFGGSWPDQARDLVPPMLVDSPGEGWMEIDLPDTELMPYERVWLAFVHDDTTMTVAIDAGDPFLLDPATESWAYTNRSKIRSQWWVEQQTLAGTYFEWIASPYTLLMELHGRTVCQAVTREFTDVSPDAFDGPVYMTRVSWGDLTGDGYDDLMIHNNRHPTEPKQRVFINNGDGTFNETSDGSGLCGRSSNLVTFADVDGDGNQDALLSVYYNLDNNPNPSWEDALMINQGNGTFVENADANVANGRTTATAAFADYDGDGLLDHFAGNTRHHGADTAYDQAMKDQLFRNVGEAVFEDVTDDAGLANQPSSFYPFNPEYYTLTNGAVWTDYDGDGDQDLYVANYGLCGNFLWENQGDGTFLEVGTTRNLAGDDRDGLQAEGTSFGAHWADYDNDGDQDLFQTEISHPRYHQFGSDRSSLRRNPGGPSPVFDIVTEDAGILWDEGDYEASWLDYDNDGLLDLYISSVYGLHFSRLYVQNPDHTFTDQTYLAGVRMHNAKSHAWADVDRDGDLDLVVGSRQPGQAMALFRNEVGQEQAWLTIRLVGMEDNRDGIGAQVVVDTADGVSRTREVRAGGGHTRQDSLPVEVGLGNQEGPVTITVTWPSGLMDIWEGVQVRRFVVATQGAPEIAYED